MGPAICDSGTRTRCENVSQRDTLHYMDTREKRPISVRLPAELVEWMESYGAQRRWDRFWPRRASRSRGI